MNCSLRDVIMHIILVIFTQATLDSRVDNEVVIRRMGELNLTHPGGIYKTYGTKSINFLVAIEELGAKFVHSGIKSMGPDKQITFCDGTVMEYDILLLNTGYGKSNFEGFCSSDPSSPREEDKILHDVFSEASYARNLYKRVVHPAVRDLYFVGFARPGFASISTIAETQARWVAALASNQCSPLPSEDDMVAAIAVDKAGEEQQFDGATRRVTVLVDYVPYVNGLASLMGATPPYLRLLFSDPWFCLRLFVGPAIVAQFRLRGPNAKPEVARAAIQSIPLPLKRRLHYISSLLYFVSILILLLSYGIPLAPSVRRKLQPVGFPPIHNRMMLQCRFLFEMFHLLSLVYLYAHFFGKISVGVAVVISAVMFEGWHMIQLQRNKQKTRAILTTAKEASKLNNSPFGASKVDGRSTVCIQLAIPVAGLILAFFISQKLG